VSRKTHQFDSKAQMRWAFATHKSWAKRWGENTELAGRSKTMPARKHPPKSVKRTARSVMSRAKK
jgi:hypothetical protein